MTSLLKKLQGPSGQSRGSFAASSSASSPSATQMYLIEVIAFGEVYAVPVTKTTPATVVLRYVMEAAVSQEQAAQMGNTEATLYYKERPLPLDTLMGKLPRRAVLHLHSSLTTTASVVRDRRQSAVSMLPQDRQRFSMTTVTMQPVLKDGGAGREGSGSTSGGLSSEGHGSSPSTERQNSAGDALPSMAYESAAFSAMSGGAGGGAPMMMFTPMMMPMVPAMPAGSMHHGSMGAAGFYGGAMQPAMMPYYCCMPGGGAGVRMLGPQGRTVSAPCLSASRRRESAVEFANSYHFPNTDTVASTAATPMAAGSVSSPRPSPPAARGITISTTSADIKDRAVDRDRHYVVVYLRLPRDRAAAGMAAAALSAEANVEVTEVQPEEVPLDELLNATFSTVATTKSQLPRAYSYRRLRVRKDFPVGTLRELCAAGPRHRLHLAHVEVADEQKTFAELRVPDNAVFYFKSAPAKSGSGSAMKVVRPLTRERLKEHLEAGAASAAAAGRAGDQRLDSPAPSPSAIDGVRPSLDRSLPSPELCVVEPRGPFRGLEERRPSSSGSSVASSQSIRERILAFNEGAVRNTGCPDADESGNDDAVLDGAGRYVVEGKELTITSAMAAEQARRLAELAARQAAAAAEAEAEQHQQHQQERGVLPLEEEEDVEVDVASQVIDEAAPTPTAATARGPSEQREEGRHRASPDPTPQLSATSSVKPSLKNLLLKKQKEKTAGGDKTLGTRKKAFRWLRRAAPSSSSTEHPGEEQPSNTTSRASSTASTQQRGPHPARLERIAKVRNNNKNSPQPTDAAQAALVEPLKSEDLSVPAEANATTTTTTRRSKKSPKSPMQRHGTPATLSATEESRSASAASGRSSRGSSVASSVKASFLRLRRRSSQDSSAAKKASTPASPTHAPAATPAATETPSGPTKASDEVMEALRRKSERLSQKKAKMAAQKAAASAEVPSTAAAQEKTVQTPKQQSAAKPQDAAPTSTTSEGAAGATDSAKVKVRKSSGSAAGTSYSERRRQSADAVPRQPVSFLGSGPKRTPPQPQPSAKSASGLNETTTAGTPEETSATLGPAALSTTRVPTPRNSPSPVSILVSPSLEQQQQRRQHHSSSPLGRTRMTEANVNAQRRATASPESRPGTPDYSVESTGSLNRLRITIKDPEDAARFHYGVPVEPECPVGALREWITSMQRPAAETGKTPPSLRDVDRYGVFAGDTYLSDEAVTFGEVTCGRNDVVFSIRSRFAELS